MSDLDEDVCATSFRTKIRCDGLHIRIHQRCSWQHQIGDAYTDGILLSALTPAVWYLAGRQSVCSKNATCAHLNFRSAGPIKRPTCSVPALPGNT